MSKREQYDEIYNSIVNGQRKQAIEQLEDLGLDEAADVLDYIAAELNQTDIALDLAKSYFRIKSR